MVGTKGETVYFEYNNSTCCIFKKFTLINLMLYFYLSDKAIWPTFYQCKLLGARVHIPHTPDSHAPAWPSTARSNKMHVLVFHSVLYKCTRNPVRKVSKVPGWEILPYSNNTKLHSSFTYKYSQPKYSSLMYQFVLPHTKSVIYITTKLNKSIQWLPVKTASLENAR